MNDQPRILFVCLGNICRSPLAEAALRAAAERGGMAIEIDSAGTSDNHAGASPDPRAIAEAKRQGIDISHYRGRQLQTQDFTRFTHIFALDHDNLADIESLAPAEKTCRIELLMDSVSGKNGHAVADPYYGDENDFSRTWDDVALAADAMVERFRR